MADDENEINEIDKDHSTTLDISSLQDALKDALKNLAVPLEKIDFTRDNYNKLFPYSKIETPIESVKMGEHQFEKLEAKQREFILKATYDTLKNPDLVINEQKENSSGEQVYSHLYAKSFFINDKVHGIQSVVVSIDGENVSISTHERDINNFVNKIKKPDQLLYAAAKVELLVERATGKQLVTVNPTREFEYVKSLSSNLHQNLETVKQEEKSLQITKDDEIEIKKSRLKFLAGKTELTDEEIITLLDLPVEKRSKNPKIFTDKSYKELKDNPEELEKLAGNLKTEPEYLKYHSTYIAKSKLLYQESSVLYNEIPCLIILDKMNVPAYLLPYEYAKDKNSRDVAFADSLKSDVFTDFKRVFNGNIKYHLKTGVKQGKDIFFLINNEKLNHDEIKRQLLRFTNGRKSENKEGTFLFFSEKDYVCYAFESDKNGFVTELPEYDLKQIRPANKASPLHPTRSQTEMSATSSDNANLSQKKLEVNNFSRHNLKQIRLANISKPFTPSRETENNSESLASNLNIAQENSDVNELLPSLLLRGEISILEIKKDIENRKQRYLDAVDSLENLNSLIQSETIKESNKEFVKNQKESRFYKDVQNLFANNKNSLQITKDNETMENEELKELVKGVKNAINESHAIGDNLRGYLHTTNRTLGDKLDSSFKYLEQVDLFIHDVAYENEEEVLNRWNRTFNAYAKEKEILSKEFGDLAEMADWLKTPTGNETVLPEAEWVFAHSSEFKERFGDWEGKIKKDFLLSNDTVSNLTGNEFSKKEGLTLTEQVEQYFNGMNNSIESPFFGKVVLDKDGADDSLSHGMGRLKAIAYAGVPNVIKKGVIIDSDLNHKDRGYNSYVIAAPIKIANENYICEVVLKQNKKETRFYLHEVTEQKKFLERAFVTNSAQKPAHQGTLNTLLEKTLAVNYEISCPLNINGEPEKSFVQNEYTKSLENSLQITKDNEMENEITSNNYVNNIFEKEEKSSYVFTFEEEEKEFLNAIYDYLDKGIAPKNNEFIIHKTPEILEKASVPQNEIVLTTGVINKAKNTHNLTNEEIKEAVRAFADPLMIFDSDKERSENKENSVLVITDRFAQNSKPIAFSINMDVQRKGYEQRLEVNEIRSIHDRTIIAKNNVNILQEWTEKGLCRYVDDKKIAQERLDSFQLPQTTINNILTKSKIVNSEETVKQEDEEALKHLYNESESVELMQQKASENAELDEIKNVISPKNETVEQPKLKIHSVLKEEEIKNLEVVTQEEFNKIVDALYQEPKPDYKNIPSIIKLPQLKRELAKKLGIENANFFMRSEIAHVRPQRKGSYDQSLRIEEMKGMLDFIQSCETAYIDNDKKHQNFMLVGLDSKDNSRSNKVVFNKDELGNYIVTVGKVKTEDLNGNQYSKMAVGVEPTIWRSLEENPLATMLRPSTTLLNTNIQQQEETVKQELPQGMYSLKNAMEIVKAREEVFDNEVNKEATDEKKEIKQKEKVDIVKKGALDFLSAVKNGTAPFLDKSNEDVGIITIKPPLVLNSSTGLPFGGSSQLLAQIYYEKQKMEGEIVTSFAGAKNAGTEIVKNEVAKKNFVLSDTSLLSEENKVLKTRYFMPEACREPEKIYAYALSKQRPQKINEYRDLIRHFENVPNGQKEIADFRTRIAEEHLKELRVKFSSKEELDLSLEQISERKDFIKNYFEKLPEKVREIEKSVFENTFGISIDIEKDYSGKNIPEKTKKQMEQKLSDFIVKNSMSENKLAALSKDEYKEQIKNQKEMGNNIEIKAVGIKEPEIYLGKYLAACQSNAKFITDEETINAVQKNLEEKLKSNFRFEKYEIIKEIGQQAEQISKETTKTLSFEKAHFNKKSNNQVIAKAQKIAPIGMGK